MRTGFEVKIAGDKTTYDWELLKARLEANEPNAWNEAYSDFYLERLKLRYLNPIYLLRDGGKYEGEGFAIAAIQCSLIEYLESTEQGLNYRWASDINDLGEYEYNSSQKIFISFLSKRKPFSTYFNRAYANDFYVGVRCGLLHEARTKNGWIIKAKHKESKLADVSAKILYRDCFQDALLNYIQNYGVRLLNSVELQSALIRKFDSLCT